MTRIGFCLALVGCAASSELSVEPAALELDVSLGQPVPSVSMRVYADDRDVTDASTLVLDDATLGALAGATFTPGGGRGGTATIAVDAAGLSAEVPVTVRIHSVRFTGGVPADAASWLAPGNDVAVADPIEPGDGAVLPPGLGKLEVDFGADAADDVHELSVSSPYADVHVFAPATHHLELSPEEWRVIAATNRGGDATIEVRSALAGGGSPVHVVGAHVELADVDPSSLVFGGGTVDATGALTSTPQLYHYDLSRAAVEPYASQPADGSGCIGCHLAVSRDGTRIVAAGKATATGGIVGMVLDTSTRSVTTIAETSPWNTGTFDPGGRLLTSWTATGELILRDGATAEAITTVALGEPAAAPDISPDGGSLAYVQMVAPEGNNPAGTAVRVRSWDGATGAVGPAITVATSTGVLAPQFSSDGAWILYTRGAEPNERGILGGSLVRADGSAPPIDIATGAADQLSRWASPIANARAGGRDAEPFAWIVFGSGRPIAASALPGNTRSLWLAPFYPARGVIGRPVHLPGQSPGLTAMHSPFALP